MINQLRVCLFILSITYLLFSCLFIYRVTDFFTQGLHLENTSTETSRLVVDEAGHRSLAVPSQTAKPPYV